MTTEGVGRMSDIRMRVLVGKYEEDSRPMIAGGIDAGTYEVIEVTEWDQMVAKWKAMFDPGALAGYEWREVTISVPGRELAVLFQHGEISGSVSS